ncbi:MAG: hypothetical protein PVF45_09325 [Anaerolineae bacterium]|jgi:hypothetical protein
MSDKDKLKAQLRGIESALKELQAEYDEGEIDVGRYLRLKTKYETRKAELEGELDDPAHARRAPLDAPDHDADAPYPAALRERYAVLQTPAFTALARHRGRLLVLWGALPFPLAASPPTNRALALDRLATETDALPPPRPELVPGLPKLPPLPILSLDSSDRLERAFDRAGVPLTVIRTRRDVPAQGRHALLKLAGDLRTRGGVILSRAEVQKLRSDPDKRHLLDKARRLAQDGALLLLGCPPSSRDRGPASEDWRAWWALLAPTFSGVAPFALGEPDAAWPEGVACLGQDFEALNAALWAIQSREDGMRPRPPGREWETFISQVVSRLDDLEHGQAALSAQLGRGVDDLKRGQAALYRRVDRAYRDDLERILAAIRRGRMEQGEMQATLQALRRAMGVMMQRGLPMDAELRAAVADLTEAVESSLGLEQKLELSLPLIPTFLAYKIELAMDSETDLHDVWNELRERWRRMVRRFGRQK